jgi:hypothetical protein
MREFPFATLVSVADAVPAFSHVPMVVLERGETWNRRRVKIRSVTRAPGHKAGARDIRKVQLTG